MIPAGMIDAITPELTLCALALSLLMLGAYIKSSQFQKLMSPIAAVGIVAVCVLLITFSIDDTQTFMASYRIDSFIQFSKLLILVGAFMSLMLSTKWNNSLNNGAAEYPVLILFASTGLMLLVSSDSLLSLYVSLELASLTMYVMAAYERDNLQSSEAGLKYFILGALASGMMLFGISLIYGFSGSISYEAIASTSSAHQDTNIGVVTGLVLLLVAVCFKVSAVPFHMWTPDVYAGAPTPVVAFFATAPKLAVICLLIRLLNQTFGEMVEYWQQVIVFASAASMLLGALAGLVQKNLKRLIAYSSIGHIGYVLLGVASASSVATESVLIYLCAYIFMSFGLFACLTLLNKDGCPITSIKDLSGLSSTHPKIALCIAVLMFSMAGIPPFAGFFAKAFVLSAGLEAGLTWLVIIAVLTSVIACFYYIRIVKVVYFDAQDVVPDHVAGGSMAGYVLLLSLAINAFVLVPNIIIEPVKHATSALFP